MADNENEEEPTTSMMTEAVKQEQLKWRGDPAETFSDWQIDIVTGGTSTCNTIGIQVDTYHVHKCMIGHGSRKSEYFARLFRNGDTFQESKSRTSRIELEPMAARAFPAMLDFLYASEVALEINTQTATGLHHLGEYFEVKRLREDVEQFCSVDLSFDNVQVYYEHATALNNDLILNLVAKCLGKNLQNIPPSSSLVRDMDLQEWVKVAESLPSRKTGSSVICGRNTIRWSKLVSEIGTQQKELLNLPTFHALTDRSVMPRVSPSVALKLSNMENQLFCNGVDDDKSAMNTHDNEHGLTSLQERCINALTDTCIFSETALSRRRSNTSALHQQTVPFLVEIIHRLVESRGKSMEDLRQCRDDLMESEGMNAYYLEEQEQVEEQLDRISGELNDRTDFLAKLQPLPRDGRPVFMTTKPFDFPFPSKYWEEDSEVINTPMTHVIQMEKELGNGETRICRYPVFYFDEEV